MQSNTQDFDWSSQQIIVTGGSGFLGTRVVENLQQRGAGNIVVPRSAHYDLREKEAVIQLYQDNPDTTLVVHLAANVGGIGYNRSYPGTLFFDNLMMGVLLLEHARLANIPKFVGVGTVCSYPKYPAIPFKEEDIWEGYPEETNAPYGLAKKMLLVQGQAYHQEFGYNAVHLVPTNLFGPEDNFDPASSHVLAALVRRFTEAKMSNAPTVTLWGDGTPTREYLYVADAANAIVLAAAYYNNPEPMNIAGGTEISIRDLAAMIATMIGYTGDIHWDTSKPNGQPRRKVDSSKAEKELGFVARTKFEDGLRETITWYERNYDRTALQ